MDESQPLSGPELAERLDAERPLQLKGFQQDAAELYILGAHEDLNCGATGRWYDPATDREYDLERIAKALDKAMRPLPFPVIAWRGGDYQPGGFISTATDRALAEKFGEVQQVLIPAGTPALWLGPLTLGEQELLLGRDVTLVEVGQDRLVARSGDLALSEPAPGLEL
jgi:hypothetical protein